MIQPFDPTYFMKKALGEALCAFQEDEIPVGAVIVSRDKIIAKAHNQTQRLTDVTAHAEMQVITAAANYLGSKYLHNCTLYVTLEPCQMCAGALYWSQISKIVFAAQDPKRGYRALNGQLHPRTMVEMGLCREEAQELLQRYFTLKR